MSTILSENTKCGYSINLPIKGHCTPTRNCAHCCYARRGRTALPNSQKKQRWVSVYLAGKDISRLIVECKPLKAIRLCGTGDILPKHVPNILHLAESTGTTQFWGMTRKIDLARELNNKLPNLRVMVSVDGSSPTRVWNYPGALCWGPRLAPDNIPDDDRIKVCFPYHSSGRVINAVQALPRHPKDCQAVWHEIEGCMSCGRCWSW